MIQNAFFLALREIRRSVMRSILTTLGIVIGIASVIAMVMLGDATTAFITQNISKLGTNMLMVIPGQSEFVLVTLVNVPPVFIASMVLCKKLQNT